MGGGLPFDDVTNPVVGSELGGADLSRAKAAGALGVIAVWRGLSDAAAYGQYLRFARGYQGLPAVWVPESERDAVLAAARHGDTATLTLDAARDPHAPMDTIWAVSTGTGPRAMGSVLVVTHSDGGNAVKENGHIGLLAPARAAANAPHDRSIVFVFTAGHLRIPTVALVTGPEYLLAETTADIVDIDALTRQVESFRALQQHLAGSADRATFGTVRLPSKLAKLRALARIGWFLLRRRG